MTARLCSLAASAAFLTIAVPAGAGEIVRRSFTKADGTEISGYVFSSGKSPRSRGSGYGQRSRRPDARYPAFRDYGFTYLGGGTRYRSVHRRHQHAGGACGYRPSVRPARPATAFSAGRPVAVAPLPRGGVAVFRR